MWGTVGRGGSRWVVLYNSFVSRGCPFIMSYNEVILVVLDILALGGTGGCGLSEFLIYGYTVHNS